MKELDQLLCVDTNFVPIISPFASADLTMCSGGQTFKSKYRSCTFESAFIISFQILTKGFVSLKKLGTIMELHLKSFKLQV